MNPFDEKGQYYNKKMRSNERSLKRTETNLLKFYKGLIKNPHEACEKMFEHLNNSRDSRNTKAYYRDMSLHFVSLIQELMDGISSFSNREKVEIYLEVLLQEGETKKKGGAPKDSS